MNKNYKWSLKTELPIEFNIKNSFNIFSIENKDLLSHGTQGQGSRRIVVVDLKVSNLYLKKIVEYLKFYKIDYHIVIIDAIEVNKNLDTLITLLKEIETFGLTRKSEPIIAVGGGVLLDIVGFAASLYRRGIPYIKVPTTLLAIVDVSVGVKTAINFENRRNRLGTYYPPIATYLDKSFLKTVDFVEISSGLGEILKMAVVKDSRLFEILKNHAESLYSTKLLDCEYADEVISRSIEGMKNELENNLWEKNLKRYVDFGHSFSPIPEIKSLTDNNVKSLTHGEAVTLDILFSSVISYNRKLLSKNEIIEIFNTTKKLHLLTFHPYFIDANILFEALTDTVKHRNGNQNLPIPKSIGVSIFVNNVTYEEVKMACSYMKEFHINLE